MTDRQILDSQIVYLTELGHIDKLLKYLYMGREFFCDGDNDIVYTITSMFYWGDTSEGYRFWKSIDIELTKSCGEFSLEANEVIDILSNLSNQKSTNLLVYKKPIIL